MRKRKETPDEWLKKTVAKQNLARQKRELELKGKAENEKKH